MDQLINCKCSPLQLTIDIIDMIKYLRIETCTELSSEHII